MPNEPNENPDATETNQRHLRQRLTPLYINSFLHLFVFWFAIGFPFLRSIGLNNVQISLTAIAQNGSLLVMNIPLGILADRWSRKGVLVLGAIFITLACLLGGLSNGLALFTAASCLLGLSFACSPGTYDSIIYDTVLEETGSDETYAFYYGRLNVIQGMALGAGSLIGGVAAKYLGLRAPFLMSVPIELLSGVVLIWLREPVIHKKCAAINLLTHIRSSLKVVVHNGLLIRVIAGLVLVTIGLAIMSSIDQLWMLALALPIALYGPVNASLLVSGSVGAAIGSRLKNYRSAIIVSGVILLGSIFLLFRNLPLVLFAQFIFLGGYYALDNMLNNLMHKNTLSNVRSSIASIGGTIGTLIYLPVALLYGLISSRLSIFKASWIGVGLAIAVIISVVIIRNYRSILLNEVIVNEE